MKRIAGSPPITLVLSFLLLVHAPRPVLADDGWKGRLTNRVIALEKRVAELDGGSTREEEPLAKRVRSLDKRITVLEVRRGIQPAVESYASGSAEDAVLLALTKVAVSLERRLRALGASQEAKERGRSTAVGLEETAARLLWSDGTGLDGVARRLLAPPSGDAVKFLRAVREALGRGPPDAYVAKERQRWDVMAWAGRLGDPRPEVALQAALELGYSRHVDALAPLLHLARTARHPPTRSIAVIALEMLGRVDAIPTLIDLITDEDDHVGLLARGVVAEIVGKTDGNAHMRDPAYRRADDVAGDTRLYLERLQVYWRDYFARNEAVLRRRSGQPATTTATGEARPPSEDLVRLVRAALWEEAESRARAEEAIGKLDPRRLPDLLRAMRIELGTRRRAAAEDRQKPWDRAQGAWLRIWISRAHDPDYMCAVQALAALRKIGSPACIDCLVWAMGEHPVTDVRWFAAASLRDTRRPVGVSALIDRLADADRDMRNTAYRSLEISTGYRPSSADAIWNDKRAGRRAQVLFRRWFRAHEKELREEEERRDG